MKNLLFICLAMLAVSCCKKNDDGNDPSPCLQEKLEAFKLEPDAVSIRTQTVNGETHYWLNDNASTYDGYEDILNENCEIVCKIGGKHIPFPCIEDYNFEDWVIIWQK